MGLAIHELASNSVRNGQLYPGDGAINVAFSVESRSDGGRNLIVKWTERLGAGSTAHEVEPLTRKFLESVVPLAVDGMGELAVNGSRVDYALRIDGSHIT